MWIALEDRSVHKSARIALIGVADQVFRFATRLGRELPLEAGEEPGAAASSQARALDLIDDVLGGHGRQNLAQRLIAAAGDILFDILWIDESTVAQSDAQLLPIEGDLFIVWDCLMSEGFFVGQPLDHAPLHQGLFDNVFSVGSLNLAVKDPLRVHYHHRSHRAEAATPCLDNTNFLIQPSPNDLRSQRLYHRGRAGRRTTRTCAYQDVRPVS